MTKTVLLTRPYPFIIAELGVHTGTEPSAALRKPDTFLYLSKDDLVSPERKVLTARLIQRHFR